MTQVSLIAIVPFALMLAAIAVMPIRFAHFWDNNRNKLVVALLLSIPVAIYLITGGHSAHLHEALVFDYIPFVILLGALFVITGGIYVDTNLQPTPAANTSIMALGTVLASFLGTTGAAMLLIRPLLHINRTRENRTHTMLFFIAMVCNCGGLLTPLGDPPLFMMYLRGAPFEWFLKLTPEWLVANALLLAIYWFVELHFSRKEAAKPEKTEKLNITVSGKLNFLWLAGVIASVAFINAGRIPFLASNHYLSFVREFVIILMALLSLTFTTRITRISNGFTWHPIVEVAYLFLGIFVTMVPCILYLQTHAAALTLPNAPFFYYVTGTLSSILDNTPTAVTYYALAQGLNLSAPVMVAGIPESLMKAICTAAVFFGAMTYIGNGPNFMVKTIAEHQNIRMPHFFGYMFKFSLIVLLPVFVVVQLLFLRS